jgi:4'-phosphopantetheinyl transferase
MTRVRDRPVIDVYWFDLDEAGADAGRFYDLLDPSERARAAQFRVERDRRRYVVRRGRLRLLLAGYLGRPAAALALTVNRFGKPALAAGALRFNLSHSCGLALYSIAHGIEVGCDLERRDPSLAGADIAERFFSRREVRALSALAPARRTAAFFNCWTRKEAYLKARGWGLSLPLDAFDVSLAPDEPAALLGGCDGWSVAAFEPAPGYHAAVVAEGAAWRLAFCSGLRPCRANEPARA